MTHCVCITGRILHGLAAIAMVGFLALAVAPPLAAGEWPDPTTKVMPTGKSFDALVKSLDEAVKANGMFVVTRASASVGAKKRGVTIPGNMVVGVYRNDFAVRMLEASVPAGIEAPIRYYVTEEADGTATLTYVPPSSVFAPYGSADLDAMAAELDALFAAIAAQAVR